MNYEWGSKTFIPRLIGLTGPAAQSMAELWMGAHAKASSRAMGIGKREIPIPDLIQKAPERILGKVVIEQFGKRLPFLFKILSVSRPLSIQVHPNQRQARQGYAKENRLKIPLEARERNYQDAQPKPEVICALGSFWALIGFRPWSETVVLFRKFGVIKWVNNPGIKAHGSESQTLRSFFKGLIHLNTEQQRSLVATAVMKAGFVAPRDPVAQWVLRLGRRFPEDSMALAPLFLNLVHLKAGEAANLAPGDLHVYLKGNAIELMANSDNTLRGGLTHKHVDRGELMRIVSYSGQSIQTLRPHAGKEGEKIYQTPAREFQLSFIALSPRRPFTGHTEKRVAILICTRGSAKLHSRTNRRPISLRRGAAVLIPAAAETYRMQGRAQIYKATVP